MTKQDVLHRIKEKAGIDTQLSQLIIESFFEVVRTAVSQGETIYIRQFGSFSPKQRAQKVARDLKTNTAILVPSHTVPYFKPSPAFTDQVRERKANSRAKRSTE